MEFQRSLKTKLKMPLTPLIDMVFLLVVFFMLTTTFTVSEAINIGFSDQVVEVNKGEIKSITVTVEKDGLVTLEKKSLRLPQFREALRRMIKNGRKKKKIFVKSDETATVQDVVSVMDQIQLAGGSDITFLDDRVK